MRIGGLFEGYGGLTMGVQAALGGDLAWYSEVEPAAVRLLEHHHPTVPNLGDVTTVNWDEVPRVDVLTGGFPCQDVSSAGRRAGMKPGTRSGLWAHMARAINVLRPNLVVIENVRGLLSAEAHSDLEPCPWCLGDQRDRPLRALGAVLGDLSVLGYDARWCGLRAADAGAPHARYRVFIAAWPAADPGGVEPERRGVGGVVDGASGSGEGEGSERERDRDTAGGGGADVADSDGVGPAWAGAARAGRRGPADDGVDVDADPDGAGLEGRRGFAGADARPAVERGRGATTDPDRSSYAEESPCSDEVHGERPSERWGSVEFAGVGRSDDAPRRGAASELATGRGAAGPDAGAGDSASAHSSRDGRGEGRPEPAGQLGGHDAPVGGVVAWGDYGPAIRRWELILGRPAPAPTQTGKRGGQQLSPAFVEWLMGLPAGHVTGVLGLSRNEQLKMLGNGVVPQQAELALRLLLAGVAAAAA